MAERLIVELHGNAPMTGQVSKTNYAVWSRQTQTTAAALARLSWLFHVPVEALPANARFGEDLKPSRLSALTDNELDHLLFDLRAVLSFLDGTIVKEVETVGEFCEVIEAFAQREPARYGLLMSRWQKEAGMPSRPAWRRFVYWLVGS